MKYGTVLIDPPWPYQRVSSDQRLRGYTTSEYASLGISDIAELPISEVAAKQAVILLWCTWPMLPHALGLFQAWGFEYRTGLPWVKVTDVELGAGPPFEELQFKPTYGVGYWLRGCSEPLLIGSRGGSHRTNYIGLLSANAKHSRKPDTVYELAESLPGPHLELFARRRRAGWTQLGLELEGDGADVRQSLPALLS